MRILFMGTPDFAVYSLKAMVNAGLEIAGVVSQPDKPKGRGHKLVPTEVKSAAEELGIEVYQPERLKEGQLKPVLEKLCPDMIVVAAYGKILPPYIINYPKYGCINVHASLLPKYRGAAPIQRAIMNGEKITGVTTMKMDEGLDTGDMLLKSETEIGEYETSEELFDRLAKIGGELLVKTINEIESIVPTPQDSLSLNDKKYAYAPMISKETARIDWNKPSEDVINLICAMNSWPMAYTLYEEQPLKIVKAVKADGEGAPGEILSLDKGRGLKIACGKGCIYVREAQFFGSKRMNVEDYARGHEVKTGIILN